MLTSSFDQMTAEFLTTKLRLAIQKKRPELLVAVTVLIHDNAKPHKSNHVKTVIDSYHWEILPQPSLSPYLSPCDYDLFPKVKMSLWGVRSENLDELELPWPRSFTVSRLVS